MVLTSKNMKSLKPQGRMPSNTLASSRSVSKRPNLINPDETLSRSGRLNDSMFRSSRSSLRDPQTQLQAKALPRSPRRSATKITPPSNHANLSDTVEIHDVSDDEVKQQEKASVNTEVSSNSSSGAKSQSNPIELKTPIPLAELISVSTTHESTTSQPDLSLEIWPGKFNIKCESADINLNIPYHSVRYVRVPSTQNTRHTLIQIILESPLTYTQNSNSFDYIEFFLGLQNHWTNSNLRQLQEIINQSRINQGSDPNLKIMGFNTKDYLKIGRTWDPAARNISRTRILKPSETTIQSSMGMTTDFSSLNRKERTQRTRTTKHYKDEDSDEEKANEQMVVENGVSKIQDFVPEEEQIYFHPNLKYKFDNNKTFTITNDDFNCLYNGNWINDTLVDFFLRYQLQLAKERKVNKADKIEIFNSFFFTSLSRPVEDDNYYKNVKSWFKKDDALFDKDFVIIPIMQDLHWYCIVITDLKLLKRRHSKKMSQKGNSSKVGNPEIDDDGVVKNNDVQDASEDQDILSQPTSSLQTNKIEKNRTGKDDQDEFSKLSDDNDTVFDQNGMENSSQLKAAQSTVKIQTGAQICILDSLRRSHEKEVEYLKHFLREYAAEKYGFKILSAEITKRVCMVPQQKNFNDCGIHVLFNVETMLADPTHFNKVILKRPFVRKQNSKIRKENHDMFDAEKRLYLRDNLRNLLVQLLKNQVEKNNGDLSKVCNLSVKDKRILDLKDSKIVSENLEDTDGKQTSDKLNEDSKLKVTVNNLNANKNETSSGEQNEEDSEDDLMIIHAEDKNPVGPDLELSKVEPAQSKEVFEVKIKQPKSFLSSVFKSDDKISVPMKQEDTASSSNLLPKKRTYNRRSKNNTPETEVSITNKRKQEDANDGKEVVKRKRGRPQKVFNETPSLSENTRIAVKARATRLKSKLVASQQMIISDDDEKILVEEKEDQNILSQDSYHNDLDFSPIKLVTAESKQLNITDQIDEELKSSVSPTPSYGHADSINAEQSFNGETAETSSAKLMADVDSALNDSRYNTPLSPVDFNIDSDQEEYNSNNLEITKTSEKISKKSASLEPTPPLSEGKDPIKDSLYEPESSSQVMDDNTPRDASSNESSAPVDDEPKSNETTSNETVATEIIDDVKKEEHTGSSSPQMTTKQFLANSKNDISPVKISHNVATIASTIFSKPSKLKSHMASNNSLPLSSLKPYPVTNKQTGKLKTDQMRYKPPSRPSRSNSRNRSESRNLSSRGFHTYYDNNNNNNHNHLKHTRGFKRKLSNSFASDQNNFARESDLFPSFRSSPVPANSFENGSNSVDLTVENEKRRRGKGSDHVPSQQSKSSATTSYSARNERFNPLSDVKSTTRDMTAELGKTSLNGVSNKKAAISVSDNYGNRRRNLRSTSAEPQIISFNEVSKDQIFIDKAKEQEFKNELEQGHIEIIEKSVGRKLVANNNEEDIVFSGTIPRRHGSNKSNSEEGSRRRLRPRITTLQDRIDLVTKNMPRSRVNNVWLGEGFIEKNIAIPLKSRFSRGAVEYIDESEEESPSFQLD